MMHRQAAINPIANRASCQHHNAFHIAAGANADTIVAKKVDITEARETTNSETEQKFKQSGLTLEVTSPVISAIQTISQMSQAASNTSDARAQGLAAAQAGLAGKNAYEAIKAGQGIKVGNKEGQIPTKVDSDGKVLESRDATAADKVGGINIAISIGSSESQSNSTSQSNTARGSAVTAGGTVTIAATGAGADSNLTIQGSNVEAGRAVQLLADNQIKLLAAQNTASQNSTNSSSSASLGISYGTNGLLVNASVSKGKGRADGEDTFYTNTQVKAGEQVSIISGGDTTLQGAVVKAEQVKADVGGNLSITSLQDTSTYTSEQKSAGGSLSVGAGSMSGSVNAAKSNINSDFKSVGEQSGIKAASGGFQVSVAGNTVLLGSVIASDTQAVNAQKNSFRTGGTLSIADIQNIALYEGKKDSFGIGGGAQAETKGISGLGIGYGRAKGEASSTSSAGISGIAGNTAVRSTGAEAGLKPIFDADKVQRDIDAQAQITQAFTRDATKAVGDFAQGKLNEAKALRNEAINQQDSERAKALNDQAQALEDTWGEGKTGRVLLHTVVGGFAGGLSGAVGAATSASAANLMNEFQDGIQKGLEDAGISAGAARAIAQSLATVTAAGIGAAVGGVQGAVTAATVDANNRQLHPEETKWIKENRKAFAEKLSKELGRKVSESEAMYWLTAAGESNVDADKQRSNGQFVRGASNTEDSRSYDMAKAFIADNTKVNSTFVDERKQTQNLFSTQNGEFYKPEVYSQWRNNASYRDYYWDVMGVNLKGDSMTAQEQFVYDLRQQVVNAQTVNQIALFAVQAAAARIASNVAGKRAENTRVATNVDLEIPPGKFDYLFGRSISNEHNSARSNQLALEMKRLGVPDSPAGQQMLSEHLTQSVRAEGNVVNAFANQYGVFEVRESLFIGPSGQAANFQSTFQVLADGTRRLSTVIPQH